MIDEGLVVGFLGTGWPSLVAMRAGKLGDLAAAWLDRGELVVSWYRQRWSDVGTPRQGGLATPAAGGDGFYDQNVALGYPPIHLRGAPEL